MNEAVVSEIGRLTRNLILHSFLYYELDESVVADSDFDGMRLRLRELHGQYPQEAKASAFYEVGKQFVESPSGFFIRKLGYPPEIVSAAFRTLYYVKSRDMPVRDSFPEFVASYGFKVEAE